MDWKSILEKNSSKDQPEEQQANPEPTAELLPVSSVPESDPDRDPVHCRFWFQVCWAVGVYQEQCTRDTDCRVYRFLERQTSIE
jgi:hypothetical protein